MDNEIKDATPLLALASEMRQLQTQKDELKDSLSKVDARLDEIRLRLIPDSMADADIRSITFEGLGRVQLAMDLYASIKDKEAGYAWLEEQGFDGLIVPYVQPSTFKAAVKEALKKGQEFPEELFTITPFMRASIVKV